MRHFCDHFIRLTTFTKAPEVTSVRAVSDAQGNFYFFADMTTMRMQKLQENPDVMIDVEIDEGIQLRVIGFAEVISEQVQHGSFIRMLLEDVPVSDVGGNMTLIKISSIETVLVEMSPNNYEQLFTESTSSLPN